MHLFLQDNWTALLNASKEGHPGMVVTLIDNDAALEHRDIVSVRDIVWGCHSRTASVWGGILSVWGCHSGTFVWVGVSLRDSVSVGVSLRNIVCVGVSLWDIVWELLLLLHYIYKAHLLVSPIQMRCT